MRRRWRLRCCGPRGAGSSGNPWLRSARRGLRRSGRRPSGTASSGTDRCGRRSSRTRPACGSASRSRAGSRPCAGRVPPAAAACRRTGPRTRPRPGRRTFLPRPIRRSAGCAPNTRCDECESGFPNRRDTAP
jgi:hypothetical protein